MRIPESILWVIGDDGCTAVKIFCDESIRRKVAGRFVNIFDDEYEKLMDMIEEEDGTCYEKEENISPLVEAPKITDDGVFVQFDSLAMYCGAFGDYIASHNAGEAITEALRRLQGEFQNITYNGYVAYCWSDSHGGETCQYRITSDFNDDDKDVIYDFIGNILKLTFSRNYVWDELYEEMEGRDFEDCDEIEQFFVAYADYLPEDAIEKLKIKKKKEVLLCGTERN